MLSFILESIADKYTDQPWAPVIILQARERVLSEAGMSNLARRVQHCVEYATLVLLRKD